MHSLGSCYLLNYLRLPVRRQQDKLLSQAVIISPSGIFCLDQPTPGAVLEWIMGVPVCPASCLLPRPRRASGGWQGPGGGWGSVVTVSGHQGSASVAEALGKAMQSPSLGLCPPVHGSLGQGGAGHSDHLRANLWGQHHSCKLPVLSDIRTWTPPSRAPSNPSCSPVLLWLERKQFHLWRLLKEQDGFSTYFEKWFCFTHQWNIEVIEFRGPYFSSQFNYLFVFYWERKYGCQVYGGKKADPVLSALACASV